MLSYARAIRHGLLPDGESMPERRKKYDPNYVRPEKQKPNPGTIIAYVRLFTPGLAEPNSLLSSASSRTDLSNSRSPLRPLRSRIVLSVLTTAITL